MEIKGTVHLIGNTEEVGSNGFTKRLIVVKTDEKFPQLIPIDFVKDKTSILDKYNVGDQVTVNINLRGSEWKGKFYVNLQGWKIEKTGDGQVDNSSTGNFLDEDENDPF